MYDPLMKCVKNMQGRTSFAHMVFMKGSLGTHHLHKFFIVDLTIPVNVCLPDHLINLLVCQFFTEVCHHMAQLSSTNETIAIFIKNFESLKSSSSVSTSFIFRAMS